MSTERERKQRSRGAKVNVLAACAICVVVAFLAVTRGELLIGWLCLAIAIVLTAVVYIALEVFDD